MKRALVALAGVIILGGCSTTTEPADLPVRYTPEVHVSLKCAKAAVDYLEKYPDAVFMCNNVSIG